MGIEIQFNDASALTAVNSPSTNGAALLVSPALVVSGTTPAMSVFASLPGGGGTGLIAGDYFEFGWASVSRCIQVDNGANLVPHSDDVDNAAWTKTHSSITANATTAPDGTATADALVEDSTASANHTLAIAATVSSAAADYAFTIAAKANSRTWIALQIIENSGGSAVSSYFNLSTGALGTLATGANWAAGRAYSSSLGNGWYQVTIIGRKTNAATSITPAVFLATADNTATYNGNGSSNVYLWRATMAQSGTPTRLVQTTTAAVAASAQSGNALYVKGLPPSTAGLLLAGDWVEVNSELKRVTATLDSDGCGLGYLQFSPPLRNSPNDGDPVIVNKPMGRFILSQSENGWATVPAYFATSSLDLVEAPQ
jgi:hypothetical protein